MNIVSSAIKFSVQFLISPIKTGAIIPSSERLAISIINTTNLHNARSVVEIGSGTGVFTQKIVGQISDDTIFFALEINPRFVKETKKRCPDVIVYQDSAANLQNYLKKHNLNRCDCIISSLPLASFNRKQQEQLLQTIFDALHPDGIFSTFTYVHSRFLPGGIFTRNKLEQMFETVRKTKIIWRNFPPASVYFCRK